MKEGPSGRGRATGADYAAAVVGLAVLGALPIVGRFLPATAAWGFGHLAFLPIGAWFVAIAAWVLLFVPPVRNGFARFCYDILGRWLFQGPWWTPWVFALLATVVFSLLATPTHLLGDGVLIGELAARGAQFRAPDAMDYLLHRLIIGWAGKVGSDPFSFSLYKWSSVLAGFAGISTSILILRRARLPRETKVMAFLIWLLSAPVLLFCGYVESYSFLAVTMLGFLWSGLLAERDEISPLAPGLFFGFALFFHSLALIGAPSLVWLAARLSRARDGRVRRLLLLLVPAIALPLAAVVIHRALGFDSVWFRREFLESKNQKQLLVHLTGPDGVLSLKSFKDIANWILLALPVGGWLFVLRLRAIRARLREPGIVFLLIQVAAFALAFLLIDRKLGPARDWDILTPQVGGVVLLAALLWQKESGRAADLGILPALRTCAPYVGLLLLWPWLAVNVDREASLERFANIKADFPTFPRAYATEELAKYYRDHGDLRRAVPLYEECVRIYPKNPRTRILLGSSYYAVNRVDEAIQQFDEALRIDPNAWLALDSRSKIALKRKDYATAYDLSRRETAIRTDDPEVWGTLGYSAMQLGRYTEANDAFEKAIRLRIDPQLYYYAGLSSAYLGRWEDAVDDMSRALQAGAKDPVMIYATAAAIEGRIAARSGPPRESDGKELALARDLAKRSATAAPAESTYARYLRHIDRVVAGSEKPENWLRP